MAQWNANPAAHVEPYSPRRARARARHDAGFGWWLVAVGLAVVLGALAVALLVTSASAGTGPGGYAQTAQTALNKAGHPFGYRATCSGRYSNYATAQVKITCTMNEQP
jgi:hypothetical protein